jgi:SnoaL-like domain
VEGSRLEPEIFTAQARLPRDRPATEQEDAKMTETPLTVTQREEHRSLYLSYLEYCNEHDFDRISSFYTSTIKVNDVPMDPAAVAAQFAPLFSAFPDWHWEIRNLVVDGDYIAALHGHRYPPGGLPGN